MTTSTVTAKAGNWLGSYLGGTFAARVFVAMTPTVSHGFGHVNQNASCTVLWIQRRSSFGRSSEVAAPTQRPVEARYAAPACASPFDRGRPPLRRRVPRQRRIAMPAAAQRELRRRRSRRHCCERGEAAVRRRVRPARAARRPAHLVGGQDLSCGSSRVSLWSAPLASSPERRVPRAPP